MQDIHGLRLYRDNAHSRLRLRLADITRFFQCLTDPDSVVHDITMWKRKIFLRAHAGADSEPDHRSVNLPYLGGSLVRGSG
ncbi:hypothetical protein D3C86_1805490 [compost metagenome]